MVVFNRTISTEIEDPVPPKCLKSLEDVEKEGKIKEEDVDLILSLEVMTSEGSCTKLSSTVREFLQRDRRWMILQPNLDTVNKPVSKLLQEDTHEVCTN